MRNRALRPELPVVTRGFGRVWATNGPFRCPNDASNLARSPEEWGAMARSATRRRRGIGPADLPANTWPEFQEDAPRRDQLPNRGIVVRLMGTSRANVENRAAGELATQLAGALIDFRVLNRLTDQLRRVSGRPLGVLSRESPQLTGGIADLDMKHIRIRLFGIDDRSAHRAQDIDGRSTQIYDGCH